MLAVGVDGEVLGRTTFGPNFKNPSPAPLLVGDIFRPRSAKKIFDVAIAEGETGDRAKQRADDRELAETDGGQTRSSSAILPGQPDARRVVGG